MKEPPTEITVWSERNNEQSEECQRRLCENKTLVSISVIFQAANPRNSFSENKENVSFFKIEILRDGKWEVYKTDRDWETRFKWTVTNTLLNYSQSEVIWNITNGVEGS